MISPTKPPTGSERKVILWALAVVLVAGGILGLCYSWFGGSGTGGEAALVELRRISVLLLLLGIGLAGGLIVLGRLDL